MKYKLNCHCGAVELEVETDLENIKQCNCSICKRKNAKMNLIPKDAIRIIKGEGIRVEFLPMAWKVGGNRDPSGRIDKSGCGHSNWQRGIATFQPGDEHGHGA